ncbi:ParB/RepB/Spo0J family partition protein [Microcoleus sp. ZQ-A2]|nr:ParB/RepB/Spo0J family partition protein [Microcoleus sp. FACHB-1]
MNRKREKLPDLTIRGVDNLSNESSTFVLLEDLRLPQWQPRRYFDEAAMQELVTSVEQHGILQPLLVRPVAGDGYEIVAGERRFRAAEKARLRDVPVIVRSMNDTEALQYALLENLQRQDLNPVEETEGILQLLALHLDKSIPSATSVLYRMNNQAAKKGKQIVLLTPEFVVVQGVFERLGSMTWETFTRNRLPLLNLPQEVLEALRLGRLEYTKAKAIALVKDETSRQTLLEEAISSSLSLSQIRERIKAVQPLSEPPLLASRIETISKLVKKHQVWNDPKKRKKLESLLAKIEELISPGGLDELQLQKEGEATHNEPPSTVESLQDSSPLESSLDPLESQKDTTLAIPSESSFASPETAEKALEQETPSSKSSDESRPFAQEEPTAGGSELTQSLTDAEMAQRLGVKTSTLGKAKKRTDFSSWSKSKDPDAKAWKWVAESKRFVPVEKLGG